MEQLYTIWRNIYSSTEEMSFVQKAIIATVLTFITVASATAILLLVQSLYNQIF